MEQERDWRKAEMLQPRGYGEFQDLHKGVVYHGNVKNVSVDPRLERVVIEFESLLKMPLPGKPGCGTWEKVPETDTEAPFKVEFPNLVVPYTLQNSGQKGRRILFGINFIYLETKSSIAA